MIELSDRTIEIVNALFAEEERDAVTRLLETECADNVPFCEGNSKYGMERIRFAALKRSQGKMDKLTEAVELARVDWRDLLVVAGFGHDTGAHNKWIPKSAAGTTECD